MRILLDEAKLGWDQAWDLTRPHAGLHEPHAPARGAGEVAGRTVRGVPPAAPGDRLRDQPPLPGRRAGASIPATMRRLARVSLIEEGRRARCGWPTSRSSARTAPTASPRSTPSCSAPRPCRTSRSCSPSGSTTRPTASRRGGGCCSPTPTWRRCSPRRSATAGSRTCRSSRRPTRWPTTPAFQEKFLAAKRGAKARFVDWIKATAGIDARSRHDLRRADQAHPRVQAATAQRAPVRRLVQPAAGEPEARRAAADVPLRGQGGPGVPPRQAHHQADHEHRPRGERRSRRRAASSGSSSCRTTPARWPST